MGLRNEICEPTSCYAANAAQSAAINLAAQKEAVAKRAAAEAAFQQQVATHSAKSAVPCCLAPFVT